MPFFLLRAGTNYTVAVFGMFEGGQSLPLAGEEKTTLSDAPEPPPPDTSGKNCQLHHSETRPPLKLRSHGACRRDMPRFKRSCLETSRPLVPEHQFISCQRKLKSLSLHIYRKSMQMIMISTDYSGLPHIITALHVETRRCDGELTLQPGNRRSGTAGVSGFRLFTNSVSLPFV